MPQRPILSDTDLDTIFRAARTHNAFTDQPVSDVILEAVWDLAKMGPTSANCSPMRVVFVKSAAGKVKLEPALDAGNREKTMKAPVTAILAMDMEFYELLPELFPHNQSARSWFAGKPSVIEETAFRNATLQAGYFILAARSVGLDCGPMSGFDKAKVNEAFFPGGRVRANFLCNLGYGSGKDMFPRSPRLDFSRACEIL
jgi:3-hydroxypropanoate dehydrogenase